MKRCEPRVTTPLMDTMLHYRHKRLFFVFVKTKGMSQHNPWIKGILISTILCFKNKINIKYEKVLRFRSVVLEHDY